ncbi:MAG TPA: hypothetical protein VN851_23960 [Thermoanaerobaculia bacterium]|nr:hypothetical protein [Thermoanaerobaculia bacterium]
MKRALPLTLLAALVFFGLSVAGHAATVEPTPDFLIAADATPVTPGVEKAPPALQDLLPAARNLSCDTCIEARMECRAGCHEALCSVGFFSCNPADPCGYACSCFCL